MKLEQQILAELKYIRSRQDEILEKHHALKFKVFVLAFSVSYITDYLPILKILEFIQGN